MIWWRDKGVKDKVKQARRAKRVAEGHQLEIGAQRAPRFLVYLYWDLNQHIKKKDKKDNLLICFEATQLNCISMFSVVDEVSSIF